MQKIDQTLLGKLRMELEDKKQTELLGKLSENLKAKIIGKQKLTLEEQIEYMKAKGIQFTLMTEEKALAYLAENSYYYKVTAYKHNFYRNSDGTYRNLDFAHLVDIAIIDMYLRYALIQLSLDIEHTLKAKLINFITEDHGEDGYSIIEEFNAFERRSFLEKEYNKPEQYIHVKDKIFKEVKNKRDYNYDTYNKGNFPIWKLIEMMSYGQLSSFIKFYVETGKFKSKQLEVAKDFLHYSKNIRDSAAHSRPLLLNIIKLDQIEASNAKHHQKKGHVKQELKEYVKTPLLKHKRSAHLLTNFRIHDLCTLIYLHDTYVKGKYIRKSRKNELFKIYKRALYRGAYYTENTQFTDFMTLMYACIRKYRVTSV